MTSLNEIVKASERDEMYEGTNSREADENGAVMTRQVIKDNDRVMTAAPLAIDTDNNRTGKAYRESLLIGDNPEEVNEEVAALIAEEDADNPGHYRLPRHFAQTNSRSGFSYLIQGANKVITIEFSGGIFSTTDMRLTELLREDIKRPDGIGQYCQEITAQEYTRIVNSAKQYQKIANSGKVGMVSAADSDSAALRVEREKIEKLQEELAQQKALIEKLQNDASSAAKG